MDKCTSKLDLTVIIPVYKVEKYIKECLDSIVCAYIDGIKVIIVDDGSPDNSGLICDEYSKKYDFITVIHIQNSGVSVARNTGIENSNSKYITFVDSDDVVKKDYFKVIMKNIKEGVDLYHFKHEDFNEAECKKDFDGLIAGIKNDNTELYMAAFERRLCYVWDKVFVSKIVKENNILFPKGIKTSEDLLFNAHYLKFVKKAIVSDEIIYSHRLNESGVASNPRLDHFRDINKVYTIMRGYTHSNNEIVSQDKAYLRFVALFMIYPMLKTIPKSDIKGEIRKSGLWNSIKEYKTDSIESRILKCSIVYESYSLLAIYFPIQKMLRTLYHIIRGKRRI